MKTIPATQFRAQCFALLDKLGPEGVVITKRGRPVAKLVPIRARSAELIGALKDEITIRADILSTGLKWEAES
jgi:prevent-host-death family protein